MTAERDPAPPPAAPRAPRAGGRFLFESLLIVLSVLLGLALNEWRQHRADRELAATAVENCRRELAANLAELERSLPVHREVQERLREVATRAGEPPGLFALMDQIMPESGLQLPVLKDVAWQTALATGALRHMGYDEASTLAGVYLAQTAGVQATVGRFSDHLFSHRSFAADGHAETLQLLLLFFHELVSQEEFMLRRYRVLLESADATAP